MNTTESQNPENTSRPLGYWLKAVDRLIAAEFASAFESEGATKAGFGATVEGIHAKITDAVSPEDLATTLATLEQVARAFGWDEETPLPHGHGRRHGFGPRGFGRPFGEWRGLGEHGHGHGHGREHGDHRRGHGGHRHAQHAYERGFDAGFSRGRDA